MEVRENVDIGSECLLGCMVMMLLSELYECMVYENDEE